MNEEHNSKQVAYGMDWLRCTMVGIDDWTLTRNRAQSLVGDVVWSDAERGSFSYNTGLECPYGAIFWHDQRPEFGQMWNSSGSNLAALREHGIDPKQLLAGLHEQGWKVTRLDLAMDVWNSGHAPAELYKAWDADELKTKARSVGCYQTKNKKGITGETVYFGSRTSNVMLRVYDKGAEQGQQIDRIRFEFEVKGDKANAVAFSVYNQGVPRTMAALFTEQILAGLPGWVKQALDCEFDVVEFTAEKDRNFWRWFESTVLPAITKAVRLMPDDAPRMIRNAILAGQEGHSA